MKQADRILRHLRIHGAITPIEALNFYGSMRLAARVNELRNDGFKISTDLVRFGGKKWARYRLIDEPQQAEMF